MKRYIGIDLGTSAMKLLLMDASGNIHNTVTKEYPLDFPQPGWSQQNPEDWREALMKGVPAYFTRNGKHYLFTSGTSGYCPNPSRVCVFDDWHGEYTDLGDPCIGDADGTTFYSQITCVLKVPGKDQYIAMADRWKPTAFGKWFSRQYHEMIKKAMSGNRHKDLTEPDRSPKTAGELPGKLQPHAINTSIARYVWLPIEWDGEKPVIRWHDEWRLEDLK